MNNDSYPAHYFASAGDLTNSNYQYCQGTPWTWNGSGGYQIFTYQLWGEQQCPSTRYFTVAFSQAAVNLGWQNSDIGSGWVSP